jgi:hypothetical protein
MHGPSDPFPYEACRDLLGIIRSIYRATPRSEVVKRVKLESIGSDLAIACELGKSRIGSLGHRAAWERAESACARLFDILDVGDTAKPIAAAACAAATRRRR